MNFTKNPDKTKIKKIKENKNIKNIKNIKKIRISKTNIYLIQLNGFYIMVDTSYPKTYSEFLRKLKKEKIPASKIKYLFLTHHHDDHAGFLSKFSNASNDYKDSNDLKDLKIHTILHENSIKHLKMGRSETISKPINRRIKFLFQILSTFHKFEFPPIKQFKSESFTILSNDLAFKLPQIGPDFFGLYTPGHTDDSMTLVLPDGSAFVGDLLMSSWKFLGHDYFPIYTQDNKAVMESWQRLIDFGVRKIYPSHGKAFSISTVKKKLFKHQNST